MSQETRTSILDEIEWGINFNVLQAYSRDLPHWRREGAVYFVTFRLRDSIPRGVIEVWSLERKHWLNTNGVTDDLVGEERLKRYLAIPEPKRRAFEREEARKLFVELDQCHGSCILSKPQVAEIVGSALRHFHGTRLFCGDFVVMPNHVHWLVIPMHEQALESILQSVKRYSADKLTSFWNEPVVCGRRKVSTTSLETLKSSTKLASIFNKILPQHGSNQEHSCITPQTGARRRLRHPRSSYVAPICNGSRVNTMH